MFYDNFARACKNKKVAPSALCKEIGIAHNSPSKWKNGQSPNIDILSKLCDYLSCSSDFLLGRTNTDNLTDNEAELISLFKKLNHDNQIRIIERIRVMIDTQDGM